MMRDGRNGCVAVASRSGVLGCESSAGSTKQGSSLFFVRFVWGKVSRRSEISAERQNYEPREENRRPSTFSKERGGEKAYSARRGFRSVVRYVFMEIGN